MELGRDAIIAAAKKPLASELVECPELGGSVRVWALTAKEVDAWRNYRQFITGKSKTPVLNDIRASLLAVCIRDEQRKRLFTNDDIDVLSGLPSFVVEHLVEAAYRLNKMNEKDLEEDEALKNSGPTDGDGSPSV